MGCDIHLYREKFTGGRWVTADPWSVYHYGEDDKGVEVKYDNRAYTGRNYDFFGVLAKGVRRTFDFSFEARGLPLQPCEEVLKENEGWGVDGHGHSYLYLHELRELAEYVKGNTLPVSGMMNAQQFEALRASIDSGAPNWELLYPYRQGTTDRSYVSFSIDMPCSFIVGDCLERVIKSFAGIDGDNHRIVFWFDN